MFTYCMQVDHLAVCCLRIAYVSMCSSFDLSMPAGIIWQMCLLGLFRKLAMLVVAWCYDHAAMSVFCCHVVVHEYTTVRTQ